MQVCQAAGSRQCQFDHALNGDWISVQIVKQGSILMIVWHQPQLSPCAIICDRENYILLYLDDNTIHIITKCTAYSFVYLCCQRQWSPECSRGGAWWSGRFQPHETRSVLHERKKSSRRRLLLSTSPSTPPQSVLYRWSPAALWYGPLSSGQTVADLQQRERKALLNNWGEDY